MKKIKILNMDYEYYNSEIKIEKNGMGKSSYDMEMYLRTICNKNTPKIEFLGFVGDFTGIYTKVVYVQDGNPHIQTIKKLKKSIIDNDYFYIKKYGVYPPEYIKHVVDRYVKEHNYELLKYGKFNGNKTNVTMKCSSERKHKFTTTFEMINIYNPRCNKCVGKKPIEDIEYFSILESESNNYKFNGIMKFEGVDSILDITCNNGHNFTPIYYNYVVIGTKCGICRQYKSNSKGAMEIVKILTNLEVDFQQEKKFDDCKAKKTLFFDFYLPDYNTLIEFDGIQHFEPVKFWGGEADFNRRKYNDSMKNKYCLDKNINLLRIRYDEDNIQQIIENFLKGIYNGK